MINELEFEKLKRRINNLERLVLAQHAITLHLLPEPDVANVDRMMGSFFESCIDNGSGINATGASFEGDTRDHGFEVFL